MNYADFFPDADVEAYRRVKRGSMTLGRVARGTAAKLVGGAVPTTGKEFVQTKLGTFRLAPSFSSDNSTEQGFNDKVARVETVVMADDDAMAEWFARHLGLVQGGGVVRLWHQHIRGVMASS